MSLLTIELKQLRFFGFHGLYEEEKKTGNEFEINIYVSYKPAVAVINDLTGSLDYSVLFGLIKSEMQKPRELLETWVMEVAEKIHEVFPQIIIADISIDKIEPPIEGFVGRVGVRYKKEW